MINIQHINDNIIPKIQYYVNSFILFIADIPANPINSKI